LKQKNKERAHEQWGISENFYGGAYGSHYAIQPSGASGSSKALKKLIVMVLKMAYDDHHIQVAVQIRHTIPNIGSQKT
jgi:hypothetical protein